MPDGIPQPAPVELEEAKELSELPADELQELIQDLHAEVESARGNRSEWETKLRENYEWRRGMVSRPNPHEPFKDSANIQFRVSDPRIQKLKPAFVLSAFNGPHVVRFIPAMNPANVERAQKLEHFYDHFFTQTLPDWFATCVELVDRRLESGKCICKITHDIRYETKSEIVPWDEAHKTFQIVEQSRAQTAQQTKQPYEPMSDEALEKVAAAAFKWNLENKVHKKRAASFVKQYREKKDDLRAVVDKMTRNHPNPQAVAELTDIVVPLNTTCIAEAEWVAHILKYTEIELRLAKKSAGGRYDDDVVDEIIESRSSSNEITGDTQTRDELKRSQQESEGVSPIDEEYYSIIELQCWLPVKHVNNLKGQYYGDEDTPVRAVLAYSSDMVGAGPLRIMEHPYDHYCWPFEEDTHNYGRRRFYDGQGVPEKLRDIEREINITKNGAINRMWWTMTPPFLHWSAAGIQPSQFRQLGQAIATKVPPQQAIMVPQFGDLSSRLDLNVQQMEKYADDVAGVPNLDALGTFGAPPTAAQVQQTVAPSSAVQTLELESFHKFLGRIYKQVFALHKQYLFDANGKVYGTESKEFKFPQVNDPENVVTLTKEDFDGEYIIMSGGDIQRLDTMLQAQQEFTAIQMCLNTKAMAPIVNAMGAFRSYMTGVLGPLKAKLWLNSEADAKKYQEQFMQMQAQAMAEAAMKGRSGPRGQTQKVNQLPNAKAGGAGPNMTKVTPQ